MGDLMDFTSFEVCDEEFVNVIVDRLVDVCRSIDKLWPDSKAKIHIVEAIAELLIKEGYKKGIIQYPNGKVRKIIDYMPYIYKNGSTCYIVIKDPFLDNYYKLYKATVKESIRLCKRFPVGDGAGGGTAVFTKWYAVVEYYVNGMRFDETVDIGTGGIFKSADYAYTYYEKKGIRVRRCN